MVTAPHRASSGGLPVYPACQIGYTGTMTKRLVEIDDDLLEQARSAAGTDTIKATVENALQRLVDQDKILQHVRRLRGPGALDLVRIERARLPRTAVKGD
jgi:Arc/MetJ family transcription regulator